MRYHILTIGLEGPAYKHGRAFCGACRGKGFDLLSKAGQRSSRRCNRCNGKGFTRVGTRKR